MLFETTEHFTSQLLAHSEILPPSVLPPPPPDSHLTPISQCGACDLAGRPLPGELLLPSCGETQQARGGSQVSHWNDESLNRAVHAVIDLVDCFFLLLGVVKSFSSNLWLSVVMTKRKFWLRAPSTLSESALLSSRWADCSVSPLNAECSYSVWNADLCFYRQMRLKRFCVINSCASWWWGLRISSSWEGNQ